MFKLNGSKTFSRLTRWLVIAALCYAFWQSHKQETATPTARPSLMPGLLATSHITDVKTGTGDAAICGQKAIIHYELTTLAGKPIFSNLDTPATSEITIGSGASILGFERGLIGMKPGGDRLLEIPSVLAFEPVNDLKKLSDADHFVIPVQGLSHEVIKAHVSLVSLSPALPVSEMNMRVFNNQLPGTELGAACGDTVHAKITVWKLDGTKLFSTDDQTPLIFTLGRSEVPYGIEKAVFGMATGNKRMAIIPPAFLAPLVKTDIPPVPHATLVGDTLKSLPPEIVIADIELIPTPNAVPPTQPNTSTPSHP